MTDYRVGDEVEVVYRGEVTYADERRIGLYTLDFALNTRGSEVRVTRRAFPKVGDKLTTVEELNALPRMAVIRHNGFHALRTDRGTWMDEMRIEHQSEAFNLHDGNTTLVLLPEN